MSAADAVPFRGSLLQDPRDIRVTRRCLVEDLGAAEDADMVEVLELPIGDCVLAFTQSRSLLDVPGLGSLEGSEAAGWLDPQRALGWLVAVPPSGHGAEDHCRRLAGEGRLLPDPVDVHRADADALAALLHGARVQAPLLLKRAREAPGIPHALRLVHNCRCPVPAKAFLLNPIDHELLGFAELWGVPLLADDRVGTKGIQVDCPGSAWQIETELEQLLRPDDADLR